MATSTGAASWARRFHAPLDAVHVVGYFAPETTQTYVDAGLSDYGMGYFASRSAAMGAVNPEVTTATFYVFSPGLVSAYIPRAWDLVSPEKVLDARYVGIETALRRGLGDLADGPDVAEAADLAWSVLDGLPVAGRTLCAAHARLPRHATPVLALWQATTVLREHRGDGHVAALVLAGLDPVEALVTAVAAGASAKFLKNTRGWSPEQWADGEQRLRDRGLLDEDALLTEAGRSARDEVETATDRAGAEPYRRLGEDGCARLMDLVRPLGRAIVAAGIIPRRLAGPDPAADAKS
ncbi:MAG TPA: hypothetical protein VLR26_15470 [Frankiaceae bacterium]|nr:hypothetical protein [Frankiaceae bacterium]